MQTITPRALSELLVQCNYLRSKAKVKIPEGITRPASLLNCFQHVLVSGLKVVPIQGEMTFILRPLTERIKWLYGHPNKIFDTCFINLFENIFEL